MANEEHLAVWRRGIDSWNRWRQSNPTVRPDLSGRYLAGPEPEKTSLSGADLRGADLREAKLPRVSLVGAELAEADLGEAELMGVRARAVSLYETKLAGANLFDADLSQAKLTSVDLTRATLEGTKFIEARLDDVNFRAAHLRNTAFDRASISFCVFGATNMSQSVGLETVHHSGPSTIGIDTLYWSKGRIPDVFLHGSGVPDTLIQYAQSLVGTAIEFYSCFISHSCKDAEFAERLHSALQREGVRCYLASKDLRTGEKWLDGIDKAVRTHEKLLVVLSADSIPSPWVEIEVMAALKEESKRRERTILFPVTLDDAYTGTDKAWATVIRDSRQVGDFRHWTNAAGFSSAFARLLGDLRRQ